MVDRVMRLTCLGFRVMDIQTVITIVCKQLSKSSFDYTVIILVLRSSKLDHTYLHLKIFKYFLEHFSLS